MGQANSQLKAESGTSVSFFEVSEDHEGQRIDNFLISHLKGVPKSRIYRIVRKGEVRVNKGRVKAEYRLRAGDVIRIPPVRVADSKSKTPKWLPDRLKKQLAGAILYEDDKLLVINKPSGLAVHGGSGVSLGLIEALRLMRPEARFLELVHRLDRDTSGCVMVAKKRSMLRFLHEQLRKKGVVDKRYLALVVGRWPNRRKAVNVGLQKNILQSGERMVHASVEGKPSITEFSVRARYPQATLVEARPITGRTHQIRVHAQYAGHPLLGDDKYGDAAADKLFRARGLKRLFLHAISLSIPLPSEVEGAVGERLEVEAALSPDLQALLADLDKGEILEA